MPLKIAKSNVLLTTEEMGEADRQTIAGGTPGIDLMEAAGAFCAQAIETFFEPAATLVLCGPGNNGGDGFVIARKLEEAGWPVRVSLLVPPDRLSGDARLAYEAWIAAAREPVLRAFDPASLDGVALVVDAVFGAGLSKDVSGLVADLIAAVAKARLSVASVDVPSGVDGNTGLVRGSAFDAELTATFFRKKPGHLLFPGRALCGEVLVGNIGIKDKVLGALDPATGENTPEAWLQEYPWPEWDRHKYTRGHAVIVSGVASRTGAARLAARAALRVGAGLVSVAAPKGSVLVHASHLTSIMIRSFGDSDGFVETVADPRLNAFVIGPGRGVGEETRSETLHLVGLGRALVLDADALTSFQETPERLFEALRARGASQAVLTPHDGECARLFPDIDLSDRLAAARAAAGRSGGVVVLKGPATVIAAPDGRAFINANAPPTLATAGAGDVLAGLICGLMAQGMAPFEAAAAGVWIHGAAAAHFGLGLIAEDLPEMVPDVLEELSAWQIDEDGEEEDA